MDTKTNQRVLIPATGNFPTNLGLLGRLSCMVFYGDKMTKVSNIQQGNDVIFFFLLKLFDNFFPLEPFLIFKVYGLTYWVYQIIAH